ncbi:MAG: copper chaperone PCu(A)C [Woeseiaceae bacterium]|nr:copper chaperone PCu(A)C [Woeseiaceae bacterium]
MPLDIVAYAPLPGARNAVAYMELNNESDSAVTITRVSSPDFASAEWHETTIENGISRMVQLDDPVIDAGGSLLLQQGGKHLMLMEPTRPMAAGSTLTLRIAYDGDRLLELTTTLKDRTAP